MTQLNEEDDDSTETNTPGTAQYQSSYDIELQALQETIQQKVVTLLSDPENSVKQTLLENGITRLCVFFGRQKANDVLLSHMITFLNDKHDWQLRGSFFDNIVGVAAYVGWQSSSILRPLLQQGMSDLEEYVVHKTIGSLTCLAELGLIQKSMLQEFVKEVAPFLAHPNIWIRHAAVGFLCAVAKSFTIADVHCNLLPQVQMFLKQKVLQLNQQVIVLNALECPIPRKVYDYILRNNHIDGIISAINARNYMRSISRYGHKPVYADLDEVMSQIFRKLVSLGMSEKHEDFILAMKDVFIKLHRSRSSSADSSLSDTDDIHKLGTLSVSQLTRLATRRHADLNKSKENKGENQPSPTSRRKKKSPQPETPTTNMNAEWKSMFGNVEPNKLQNSSNQKSKSVYKSDQSDKRGASQTSSVTSASISSQSSSTGSIVNVTQSQVTVDGFQRSISPSQEVHSTQTRYSSCKLELRNLVHHRREQYSSDIVTKEMLEGIVWDSRPPPTNWRPKGLLVAHLHEHRDAINKIDVSHDQSFFLTCSDDGSVKVWKCDLLEGKSAINRSRHTLAKQGGKIKCLTFCDGSDTFAAASDNGTINAYRIESGKVTGLSSHKVDLEEYGQVVDMLHFDSGSQQVLAYATVNGYLIGQDFRSQSLAWKLQNQPKTGLITSFAVHNSLCWLAMGTSNGSHVCWDMRFQLPITTISHPTGARVRKLLMHPREQSWIVSALQGNNEVSMWDVETGARQKVLWASSAPALSQTQASSHSVYGMNMVTTDNNMYLLTGGSDQRVRFWDLGNPNNSFVLAGAACDPHNQMVVNYSSRLIDGTEVVQEVYTKKQSSNEDIPRRGPESPAQGHHDIVSDVNICQGQQCLVITASRDGVLQVWK